MQQDALCKEFKLNWRPKYWRTPRRNRYRNLGSEPS